MLRDDKTREEQRIFVFSRPMGLLRLPRKILDHGPGPIFVQVPVVQLRQLREFLAGGRLTCPPYSHSSSASYGGPHANSSIFSRSHIEH